MLSVGQVLSVGQRRRSPRFEMYAPVLFRWTNASGEAEQSGGFSYDIALDGIFIFTDGRIPPLGKEVSMEIMLPSLSPASKRWRLHANTLVVRIQDDSDRRGFAVMIETSDTDLLGD